MPIEDALKAEAAIISNAMLLGDKLKFLSMLLTLKVGALPHFKRRSLKRAASEVVMRVLACGGVHIRLFLQCDVDGNGEPTDNLNSEALAYCQQHGVTATKVSEIIANKEPAIYRAIQEALERVNARSTSNAQKVQKWVILDHDFSISGGELGEYEAQESRFLC